MKKLPKSSHYNVSFQSSFFSTDESSIVSEDQESETDSIETADIDFSQCSSGR